MTRDNYWASAVEGSQTELNTYTDDALIHRGVSKDIIPQGMRSLQTSVSAASAWAQSWSGRFSPWRNCWSSPRQPCHAGTHVNNSPCLLIKKKSPLSIPTNTLKLSPPPTLSGKPILSSSQPSPKLERELDYCDTSIISDPPTSGQANMSALKLCK